MATKALCLLSQGSDSKPRASNSSCQAFSAPIQIALKGYDKCKIKNKRNTATNEANVPSQAKNYTLKGVY